MYGCGCGCGGFAGGYGGYGVDHGCYYPGRSSFILIVVLFILLIIVGKSYTC